MEVTTSRLRLIALDTHTLELYLIDPQKLETWLGFPVSRAVVTDTVERAIGIKLAKMAGAPRDEHAWYTSWLIVVQAEHFGAGLVGFKGAPDITGSVELGYGIDPACQRKGYMTEAVGALVEWAFADPRCRRVTAETLQENAASIRVLEKNGLNRVGERGGMFYWAIDRREWLAARL